MTPVSLKQRSRFGRERERERERERDSWHFIDASRYVYLVKTKMLFTHIAAVACIRSWGCKYLAMHGELWFGASVGVA